LSVAPARAEDLFEYLLRLGDTSLVLGHRLSEWCGHGPALEEDLALANVALDLIGQARMLLEYAGSVEGKGRSEDDLAYLRDGREYRNVLLAEQPNGHYGDTIARQFLFDAWAVELWGDLVRSSDAQLAAIAAKAVKEHAYHWRHSSGWLIRLGDGTEESHGRMQASLENLWPFTGELFAADAIDLAMRDAGVAPDLQALVPRWNARIAPVLAEATLARPADGWMQRGGKTGRHSEHLGHLLAVMQSVHRAHPGARW
jgi:ring-1,2-phenylacetyl-CoA epoxidase subunit PaaC